MTCLARKTKGPGAKASEREPSRATGRREKATDGALDKAKETWPPRPQLSLRPPGVLTGWEARALSMAVCSPLGSWAGAVRPAGKAVPPERKAVLADGPADGPVPDRAGRAAAAPGMPSNPMATRATRAATVRPAEREGAEPAPGARRWPALPAPERVHLELDGAYRTGRALEAAGLAPHQ